MRSLASRTARSLRSLLLVGPLAALGAAAPAWAQYGFVTISDGGVVALDGETVEYTVSDTNTSPINLAPGQGTGTFSWSAGLTLVGDVSDENWSCVPAGAQSLFCTYLQALPIGATTIPGTIRFQVDSRTAAGTCVNVAPPCVSVTGTVNPLVTPGFDDTHVVGPNPTRWVNGAGGAFEDPANWSAGPPEADDTAIFDLEDTYTVTLAGPATVSELQLPEGDVTLGTAPGTTLTIGQLWLGPASGLEQPRVLRIAGGGELVVASAGLALGASLALVDGSTARVTGPVDVDFSATISVAPGGVASGAFVFGSEAYPAAGTALVSADGSVLLRGQVDGRLENHGIVRLNGWSSTPVTNVTGDFVQGADGSLDVDVFGTPGVSLYNGTLRVTGSASFGGAFRAVLSVPDADIESHDLEVVLASSVAGSFASLSADTHLTHTLGFFTTPVILHFGGVGPCFDGADNDGDSLADADDPQCAGATGNTLEAALPTNACGLGIEPGLLVPLVFALRARRRLSRASAGTGSCAGRR